MSKYKVTPEQVEKAKEKLKKTLKSSETIIKDLINNYETSIDEIVDLINFSAKFHKYSMHNTALIYKQMPYATFCASFKDWKKLKANILKGSKGATIIVPKTVKYIYNEQNHDYVQWRYADSKLLELAKAGKTEIKETVIYGTGTVFDIGQTDFPKEKYPSLYSVGIESQLHSNLFDMLVKYCNMLGCKVEIKQLNSIALNGYYNNDTNVITINYILNDTNRLSTLSHEFGHMIAEHKSESNEIVRELEADILSIMFFSYFNLPIEEKRKNHFKQHIDSLAEDLSTKYNNEKKELKFDNKQQYISFMIEEIMNNTFEIYKKHAVALDDIYKEYFQQRDIKNEIEYEDISIEL